MSLRLQIGWVLALTAGLSFADKLSLQQLMELQSQLSNDVDYAETKDNEYSEHFNGPQESIDDENLLEWKPTHLIKGRPGCDEGWEQVGAAECVRNPNTTKTAAAAHQQTNDPMNDFHGQMYGHFSEEQAEKHRDFDESSQRRSPYKMSTSEE